jgi:membrane protease YdiL (CAAX protease family)
VLRVSALARALAIACCVPLIVLGANVAHTAVVLTPADALSLDALASAASLALLAIAGATLGPAPIATRLGLGAGRLDATRVAIGAIGVIALSHAAEGLLQWSGVASPGLARFDEALAGLGFSQIAFPLLALAIGSACGEELFFRGLLQRGLAPALGRGVAIAIAAVAFGVAHGDLAHGAAAALLGFYLGLIADAADSIRAAIVAHASNNAMALFEVVTELRIPEGPFATPAAIVSCVTLACVALATVLHRTRADARLQSPSGAAD